jgi:hypothetical protein
MDFAVANPLFNPCSGVARAAVFVPLAVKSIGALLLRGPLNNDVRRPFYAQGITRLGVLYAPFSKKRLQVRFCLAYSR